jgi:hypothetical protein
MFTPFDTWSSRSPFRTRAFGSCYPQRRDRGALCKQLAEETVRVPNNRARSRAGRRRHQGAAYRKSLRLYRE